MNGHPATGHPKSAVQTRPGPHSVQAEGTAARTAALLRWPVTAATMVLAVLTLSWRALPEISPEI